MSMKNNRTSLDSSANAIRESLKLKKDLSVADVFRANIGNAWAVFGKKLDEGLTDDEAKIALKPVNDAIALYHDEMRMERLEQLATMSSAEADSEYLRTQCVNGFKVVHNAKDNTYSLVEKVSKDGKESPVFVPLSAYDFVNYVHPTEMNGIKNACVIFADNLVKSEFGSDKGISRKAMSQGYIDLRERMGWTLDGKTSNTQLAKQLTDIFSFMMRKVEFKAINADVKFIKNTIIQGVDKADSAGAYILRNEETIINTIFRAAYTRVNDLPYAFQVKTNASANPFGFVENKAMSEPKASKEKDPVVTEDKVFSEESGENKSAVKKLGK